MANVFLILLMCLVVLPLIWLAIIFNRFVRLRQHIRESWADIDVELKRRYDLIPNLVESVKGYARHERDVLEQVVRLRAQAAASQGAADQQAADETQLQLALKRLFVVVESYPELRANANFLSLQRELSLTEDRLAASRRFYNANVREMNQLVESFPTNLVASLFSFQRVSYFELQSDAERVVPRLDLSPGSY